MGAVVVEVQVGGSKIVHSLKEACEEYLKMLEDAEFAPRTKIHFTIRTLGGEVKAFTVRDEDTQTVAYGDFEGLPSFLDYAKEAEGI